MQVQIGTEEHARKLNTIPCAVCTSRALKRILLVHTTADIPARLVRCGRCGLVQVNPLPSEEELKAYYEAYSYAAPRSWSPDPWKPVPATIASLHNLVASFEPFRQLNRLLDIGCGAGHLLRVAQQKGWKVYGTELSAVAAERLSQEGLWVHNGHLASAALSEATFDIITMGEVLEHLREPVEYLRSAFHFLRPGGALYLSTPNFASLASRLLRERWRIIAVPEHLFYFSPFSLRYALQMVGFRSITIRTENLNPVEIVVCLKEGKRQETITATWQSMMTLQDATFRHPLLRAGKNLVNAALRVTGLGDTIKALAIK
jgi:2-polyprenyl-3-methyl-5-hydroxy-6-metoxy-1,4-benzoquinol methylase